MPARPNIVFILADDLGFADLGCYGGRVPVSPVLDGLAANGLRFTWGYSNSPVCSPTRYGLITGRYQYHLRAAAEEPMSSSYRGDPFMGLDPKHPTFVSLLRDSGYYTALSGKWHCGYPPAFGPQKSGYLEHFGCTSGGVDYFTHCERSGLHDLWENGVEVQREGYLTDLLSQRAVEIIDKVGPTGQPLMLSLHYTAPHWPWERRQDGAIAADLHKRIEHSEGGSIHIYREMIRQMDEGIGWVVEALKRNNMLDNTLIVFTSDNGGERFSDNWPLVGGKMDLTEGGIRVPYVVHWPAIIRQPGQVCEQLSITMDWSATILAAAAVEAAPGYPLEGISLLPMLSNPKATRQRELFWRMKHNHQRAMRSGAWKYLAIGEDEFLFNVELDERERANLKRPHADQLHAMRARYDEWQSTMPPIPQDAKVSLVVTNRDMPKLH
jgi:arylsulfatase A-like enzyme